MRGRDYPGSEPRRVGGLEAVGDPERWVLEGGSRGCLREGAPSKKLLGKGAVRRDVCWEKGI